MILENYINFKNIADDLQKVGTLHKQINSYGLGDTDQLSYWTQVRLNAENPTFESPFFPLMYVVPSVVTNSLQFKNWEFNVIVMDILDRDLTNQVDVLSDTLQIQQDITSQFKLSITKEYGCYDKYYDTLSSVNYTPFLETYSDLCNGWTQVMNIVTATPLDRCEAAFNTFTGTPIIHDTINFKTFHDDFRLLADHHKQINSFGFGNLEDLSYWTESRLKEDNTTFESPFFPLLYVVPGDATQEIIEEGSSFTIFEFNCIVLDIIDRDLTNQVDVLSDTNQILDDIISQFRLSVTQSLGCFNAKYYLDDEVQCIPFLEKYSDLCGGWNGVLRIKVMTPLDRCAAPFNSFIPPTPTPTITPTSTSTPTPTNTQTPTNTPTTTPTNTPTNTSTPTNTPSKTPTRTPSQTPTSTPTNTPSNTPTKTPTRTPNPTTTPTNTSTPTKTPTRTPSQTPTETPTNTPTMTATQTPSYTPSETPTNTPTNTSTPTETPTNTPTETPTNTPTNTGTPTNTPSETPTNTPTETPTSTPTETPTSTPTETPTNTPTNTPSETPTNTPTITPTGTPTTTPTNTPTTTASQTPTPTNTPTNTNTPSPTPTTAVISFSGNGFNLQVAALSKVSGSNKLYIGGNFTQYPSGTTLNRMVRVNENGTPDTSFSIGTGFNNVVRSITEEASTGKVYVGGDFTTYTGTSINRFLRLNSDGSRDTTFSIGTGFAGGPVYDAKLQSDGKIIVVGFFTTFTGTSVNGIVRLNTDGSRDTTFSAGTGFSPVNAMATNVIIDSSGQIVVVGQFTGYNGTSYGRIIRLNTDGSVDTTFSAGTGFNSFTYGGIHQLSTGQYNVFGDFTSYNGTSIIRAARINSGGTIDNTYTPSSIQNFVFGSAIDSQNRAYIIGAFNNVSGVSTNGIARLTSGGTYDSTYVTGGGFNTLQNSAFPKVIVENSGNILWGGIFTTYSGQTVNRILRTNQSGNSLRT